MNCKEFWERWTIGEDINSHPELRTHLDSCHECNSEMSLLMDGISELKKEIFDEEPAYFWHEMKNEIYKNVKIPSKKCFNIWSWKRGVFLIPTLVALVLFFLFTMKDKVILTSEDIYLLAGGMPVSTISASVNQDFYEEDYNEDEQLTENAFAFIGISDPMAALLIETS